MGRRKVIESETLLKIAREVFLEEGALGSTKDIAARAGISEAALFKRYPTKSALFLAALAPPPADKDYILAEVRAAKDARAALHVMARQVLAYYRMALPRMLHLITHPAIGLDSLPQHMNRENGVVLDGAVAAYLREQHVKGEINAPNARAAAGVLVAMLHSVVLFEIMGVHGGRVPQSVVDEMIDIVWQGLRPTKPVSPRKRRRS
jgi:AcrR family transcriptional regulator